FLKLSKSAWLRRARSRKRSRSACKPAVGSSPSVPPFSVVRGWTFDSLGAGFSSVTGTWRRWVFESFMSFGLQSKLFHHGVDGRRQTRGHLRSNDRSLPGLLRLRSRGENGSSAPDRIRFRWHRALR